MLGWNNHAAVTPAYTRCVNLAMPQFKGVEMSTFGFSSEGVVDIQLRHHAGEVGMHGAVPGALRGVFMVQQEGICRTCEAKVVVLVHRRIRRRVDKK
jgi:hypothetical protein